MPNVNTFAAMSARGFGAFSNVVFDLLVFSGNTGPTAGASILTGLTVQKVDEGTGAGASMTTSQVSPDTVTYQTTGFTKNALLIRTNISPTVRAYQMNALNGIIGTAYTAPATALNSGSQIKMSPDNSVVFFSNNPSNGSPIMQAYAWTDQNGFGTKYADSATNTTGAQFNTSDMNVRPQGDVIAISTNGTLSNELCCIKWDNVTGFGTKYVTGDGYPSTPIKFSRNGDFITAVNTTSGALRNRPWSSSGFGTVVSQTITPTKIPNTITYTADSSAIAFSSYSTTNPILIANAINPSTGVLGTAYTAFSVTGAPTSINSAGATFSSSSNSIAVKARSPSTTPGQYVIGWSNGFTTAYTGISSSSNNMFVTYKKV